MRFFLTIVLLCCGFNGFSQTVTQKIDRAFSSLENDPQLKYSSSSLTVMNANTAEILFSRNGDTGLAPASTLKTISAASAFHLLGSNFKWETTLGYSGAISAAGVLNGDLILTGSGDPTLGSWRYETTKPDLLIKKWADAVHKSGIKRVSGRIIADDQLFGTQTLPPGWIWQDIGNYYGAGPNSLSWQENQAELIFIAGAKAGDPTTFKMDDSEIFEVKIVNEVLTGSAGSGDQVYAFSSPYSNVIYLRGTYGIDLKKKIAISVPDPALQLGHLLQKSLEKSGVTFGKMVKTSRQLEIENMAYQKAGNVISVHTSPDLSQVIYWFNQKSINLYGEHLLKTMALKKELKVNTENGTDLIKEFWKNKLGIDENALNIVDGSGLSPGNRITTKAMAMILQSAKKELWFKEYFDSFPVYNNMKMKSGSINGVIAYTGYQTSASGTPLVFSIIINNYSGSGSLVRQKMFRVLDNLK
ncbi:D-alanyl-D-alanine carboxypeptidase/D-alanyl-D-alanine endopeptidase [Daejeonella oryzae]|uniref:D-alanyl-D-alanine carboxypeptidase/D-alanyl-D-alanine endopeptidase n=1 Tax=Daejeonella oryzae TaxID=1122943 RepID=UPI0003FB1DE1|nr:D-alanyl-D-alanine carboxypeptidase/D-alanyl-D-alanine-endopeptidase [Daejeonella oryzae]